MIWLFAGLGRATFTHLENGERRALLDKPNDGTVSHYSVKATSPGTIQ